MPKVLSSLFLAVMLFAAMPVHAGEPAAQQAPEVKRVGIVYIQQVFQNYRYATDTENRIREAFQPEQTRIEGEIARVQEMERSLQNNPLMNPNTSQWRRRMMEIEAARLEVQSMQEEFGKRVREEEAAFWTNMYNAFQRACKILGDYYSYDLILAAPDPALSEEALQAMDPMAIQQEILMRRVQYTSEKANITGAVTELLNARYNNYLQNPSANSL